MCLCVGPGSTSTRRSPLGRLWWQLAGSPGPLFAASAVAQIGIWVLLPALNPATMVAAITLLALTAWLLESLPNWSGRSPVHYVRSATLALLLNVAVPFSAGLSRPIGTALLALAAWMLWRTSGDHLTWIPARHRTRARLGTIGLAITGVALLITSVPSFRFP